MDHKKNDEQEDPCNIAAYNAFNIDIPISKIKTKTLNHDEDSKDPSSSSGLRKESPCNGDSMTTQRRTKERGMQKKINKFEHRLHPDRTSNEHDASQFVSQVSQPHSTDDLTKAEELRRKRRRKPDITEADASEVVRNMLQKMRNAADGDNRARAEGRPALHKLKLLAEACSEIAKPKWVQWYLREGVCVELARWLIILPNGVLPNMTIRSRILQLMNKIPKTVTRETVTPPTGVEWPLTLFFSFNVVHVAFQLSIEYVHGTELGVRLVQLWRSPDELAENRVLIRSLIQSLIGPMLDLGVSRHVPEASFDTGVYASKALVSDSFPTEDGAHAREGTSTSTPHTQVRVKPLVCCTAGHNTMARARNLSASMGYPTHKMYPKSNIMDFPPEAPIHRDNQSIMVRLDKMITYKKSTTGRSHQRGAMSVSRINRKSL